MFAPQFTARTAVVSASKLRAFAPPIESFFENKPIAILRLSCASGDVDYRRYPDN
jgi:hypothetical protein